MEGCSSARCENPRRLAFLGLGVTALMLPMLSNDVFSVFAYGSLAARGQDVYTTASALPGSVWYPWIGAHWIHSVCVYGPTTLVGVLPPASRGGTPGSRSSRFASLGSCRSRS